MTDKEKKSKIADILMDFQEEYSNEVINRPMLASLYAGNILSFIDSLQEEPVSEDLEEAANNALNNVLNTHEIVNVRSCLEMFRLGAKWQKEQMMAKGVDGVVHHFEKCGVASVHYNDPTGVPMSYFMSPKGIFAGDKVKIIVIKED